MGGVSLNQYDDATRGTFQTEYGKQLVLFDGLVFKGRSGVANVTPTDIDGFVQLDTENCFIFFELKHSGYVPKGQASALQNLADAVRESGSNSVIFVAEHNTKYPDPILAKDAIVKWVYWNGKWTSNFPKRSLREFALRYVDWLGGES